MTCITGGVLTFGFDTSIGSPDLSSKFKSGCVDFSSRTSVASPVTPDSQGTSLVPYTSWSDSHGCHDNGSILTCLEIGVAELVQAATESQDHLVV